MIDLDESVIEQLNNREKYDEDVELMAKLFDEKTQELLKRFCEEQKLKYTKLLFQMQSNVHSKLKLTESDMTPKLAEMIRNIKEYDLNRIMMFEEREIRVEYQNYFFDKCSGEKEALNIKNQTVRETYNMFREFLENFDV